MILGTIHRTARVFALVAAGALLVSSCGRLTRGSPAGDGGIAHPTGEHELILRVDTRGGFLPVEHALAQVPEFTLVGDGRVFGLGAQIEIYPPPALPPLFVRPVTEEAIQGILEAARRAGLFGPDRHYEDPFVADAATTTFTLVAEGRTHVVSAYALSFPEEEGSREGLPPEERRERERLASFRQMVLDLEAWLPVGSVGEEAPYTPDRMIVHVREGLPNADPDLASQEPVEWPLSIPLAEFAAARSEGSEFGCGTVEGEDLETLMPLFQRSNRLTPWRSGGEVYQLVLRPLLTDEDGCPSPAS